MPMDLESRWPGWPEGQPGSLALDLSLDTPVDAAFLLIYGGNNDMRRALDEANGNKDFSTTDWLPSAEAVEAAAAEPSPPPLDASGLAALRPGWLRRASYSGSMMGSKFRNEELHRLQEVVPGSSYRVLTTVFTTAMHGEKFRPVVQSTLVALPDGRCRYTVRTTILFVTKPNGFIKAMIDKGAREGQRKNFEALRKVLAQHTRISEAPAGLPAAPEAAAAAGAAPAAEPAEAAPAAAAGLLETLAGTTAFRQLQPWAAWLHARLDAAAPTVAAFVDTQVLLALLCMVALLGALRLVVDMLLFIQHAAAQPRDAIGLLTHHVLRLVDVPESMQEVLVSCLILYTVRLLVNRLAGALPAPPRAAAPAAAGAAPADAAVAGPSDAAATPSAAAAAAGEDVAVRKARSEEAEGEGIKYEGYAEAIAAAQAQPISPTVSGVAAPGAGSPEESATGGSISNGGSLMKSLTKSITNSFTGAFAPTSRSRKSPAGPVAAAAVGAAAGAAAGAAVAGGAAGAAPAPPATGAAALPPAVGPLAEALPAALPVAPPSRSSMASVHSAASEDEGAGARPVLAAGSPLGPAGVGVPRSKSDGEALQQPASLGAVSPSAGSEASLHSPDRSLSPGPDRRRTSGGGAAAPSSPGAGMPHSKSAGALAQEQQAAAAEQSGSSMASFFLGSRRPRAQLSPSGQPSSPREAGPEGAPPGSPSPDQMLSPTAAQRDFRPAMPAHLPPGLASKAVIEEVFENQRLQPFRGWGHTWPGHFLPTDKVNHWSRREQEGFPVLAGSDFSAIAPPLPEGWQWCEEKWHLDLSPQIIDACDAEGWSYGLDFPFVKHPFQPNSGRKKISDFVRRRRWIRTRVPLELSAPRATAISADTSSWDKELGPAAALAADASTSVFTSAGNEAVAPAQEATPGSLAAASTPASTSSSPGPVSSGTEGSAARAAALGMAAAAEAAAAAAPAAGESAAAGLSPSLPPSESSEMHEVHAVLESIFARVEERSASTVQADMREALAQQIGTRSPSKPQAKREQQQRQPAVAQEEEAGGREAAVPATAAVAAPAEPDEGEAAEEDENPASEPLALQQPAAVPAGEAAEGPAPPAPQPEEGADSLAPAKEAAGSEPADAPVVAAAPEQEPEAQAPQTTTDVPAEVAAAAVPEVSAAASEAPDVPASALPAAAAAGPGEVLEPEGQPAASTTAATPVEGHPVAAEQVASAAESATPAAASAVEEAPAAAAGGGGSSAADGEEEEEVQAAPSPTVPSAADSLHLVAHR